MMFSQKLNTHIMFKRLAKALIRLRVCAGWSEALLDAHTTLLEISCRGSYEPAYQIIWISVCFTRIYRGPDMMVMYYGIYHNDVASESEIRHAIKSINQ